MPTFLLILAAAASTSGQCHKIQYWADGTRQESWVADDGAVQAGTASATVHSSGLGTSHSSVSASSHSSGESSSSSATSSDGHRSVTVTRDDKGCTIVIDERPATGR
ncbi:hypothetical protein [Novosphingobium sp. 9U]|uniref:hypothetical protein n=1 Tax=Novosphingobium sp. 9U TaxID=2653158 RepID=UPI00135B2580|nr:hypothetical protein [Novosphingobium sp. 9U]